jgi:protein-L-isoaspartate(D-aspartate) O-methyltransferase
MNQEDEQFYLSRMRMVKEQIANRFITDRRVLAALENVPRHAFVSPEFRHLAYSDGPLPIGLGQTISQPYIVALMCQLSGLKGDEKVLEVGTGSGYGAAVLAELARAVYSVERHPELARLAERVLHDLAYLNVHVHVGDGSAGLPEFAPYDAILVTAAAPLVPEPLLDQLAEGGRLVLPVGERGEQYLQRWTRHGDDFAHQTLIPVAFVPLVGKYGWK